MVQGHGGRRARDAQLGARTLSTTWVALLRAVNVGRHNRMKMSDLRALLEALGYTDVRTHLQSGNAIFTTQRLDAADIEQEMSAGIRREIGMEVTVLVRAAAELRAVIAANPFTDTGTAPNDMHVTFLSGAPPADAMTASALERFAPHRFALGDASSTCVCTTRCPAGGSRTGSGCFSYTRRRATGARRPRCATSRVSHLPVASAGGACAARPGG